MALVAGLAACTPALRPAVKDTHMDDEAKLEWSMAVEGPSLRVRYKVTNVSDRTIHVCDSLLVDGTTPNTYRRAPGRLVVRNGDQPGEVHFILGQVGTQAKLFFIYPVTFR
jgi:hypothetical protein